MFNLKTCRVCLAEPDPQKDDQTEIHKDEELKKKFEDITGIQLVSDDPDIICAPCKSKLTTAFVFRQNALSTHKYLRQFLDQSRSIFEDMRKSIKIIEVYEEYEFLDNEEDRGESTPAGSTVSPETKVVEEVLEVIEKLDSNECGISVTVEDGNCAQEDNDTIAEQYFDEFYEVDQEISNQNSAESNDGLLVTHVEEVVEEESNDRIDDPFGEDSLTYLMQKQRDSSDSEVGSMQCDACLKFFKTKMSLKIHKKLHTGEKNFHCEYCGKNFATKGILKQHVYIHTGEKPFVCKQKNCGRSFTQSKSLVAHMRRHTGEKPFACSDCELTFRTRDALKVHHSVKHAKVKPRFFCGLCNKGLSTKHSLQLHMQQIHKKSAITMSE